MRQFRHSSTSTTFRESPRVLQFLHAQNVSRNCAKIWHEVIDSMQLQKKGSTMDEVGVTFTEQEYAALAFYFATTAAYGLPMMPDQMLDALHLSVQKLKAVQPEEWSQRTVGSVFGIGG